MLIQIGARSIVRLGHFRPVKRTDGNGRYFSAGLRSMVSLVRRVVCGRRRVERLADSAGASQQRCAAVGLAIRPNGIRPNADDYRL
ncbi:hypothetical protein FAZ95_02335 [Trinickia violacea]|uniref:Uncharacterized protein n=1 Tax=Trinickia violacea TaxID=2571746 RepID=A0A4P8IHK1_9BURK|nr:hypothetical protein FAZ95_02335 [Trinickia violacea]